MDLQTVFEAAHRRHVERDAIFFHQGNPAVAFYLLGRGEAKLTQVTPEDHQMLARFVAPGEEFGGIATLRNATYILSTQAVEDCLALAWNGETLA